ncbi:hypothetical protein HOLleu_31716 [Holothuria leucospilota]|uniref:Peptidase A2 domain-containing protein n=1 Tax=Holothuria leucospilota TaxID=206669 RepID=A0A9Q1BHG7_HOLLE|nr:hypothetical protein HOLleu_31716 [Holothuria leucospilota]
MEKQLIPRGSKPVNGRNLLNKGQGLALRTVPIIVRKNGKQLKVNAILDDGSEQTYINSGLAAELGVSGEQNEISVGLINGLEKHFKSMEIKVEIMSVDK